MRKGNEVDINEERRDYLLCEGRLISGMERLEA